MENEEKYKALKKGRCLYICSIHNRGVLLHVIYACYM